MSRYLTPQEWDEYLPLAPERDGDQIATNHCKDGANNARFYIKRSGNKLLAFCHHCGKRGIYYLDDHNLPDLKARWDRLQTPPEARDGEIYLPYDITHDVREWPQQAHVWLLSASITPDEASKDYGIRYSPFYSRIILPVYHSGDLVGYQSRKVFDQGDPFPKYLSRFKSKDLSYYYLLNRSGNGTECVVVEDILSAIRINRDTGLAACAVLGNFPSDHCLNWLVSRYSKITIWFDDDNAQVKANQLRLKNTLDQYGVQTRVIKTGRDPKKETAEGISDYLGHNPESDGYDDGNLI